MTDLAAAKAAARAEAVARRKPAHQAAGGPGAATGRLLDFLAPHAGQAVSGYLPIRSEIDPRPAMAALARLGPVAVPVIPGPGQPLEFHRWTPQTLLVPGPFGAMVPADPDPVVPRVLIVPLLAFDPQLNRLGYGGGFYDRTLQRLRAAGPVLAVGLAYAAQRQAILLPVEPTDQRLDAVVTEETVFTAP